MCVCACVCVFVRAKTPEVHVTIPLTHQQSEVFAKYRDTFSVTSEWVPLYLCFCVFFHWRSHGLNILLSSVWRQFADKCVNFLHWFIFCLFSIYTLHFDWLIFLLVEKLNSEVISNNSGLLGIFPILISAITYLKVSLFVDLGRINI